jgi:glycosyltransferase involved in cell wall biosynthesis
MISIVVPAFNEELFLSECLASLKNQAHQDFEIIVVANANDSTSAIARNFGAKVIVQPIKGIARARQSGFMAARGEIIASTDADTIVPEDWLQRIEVLFKRHPDAVAVAGHFSLYDGPQIVRMWIKISMVLMPCILKFAPWLWNFGGFNFAVKADVFHRVGGFNLNYDFGEDIDLCRRLKKIGEVVFDPHLEVRTSGRAFLIDRLGLNNFANYLSVLIRSKPCLPVIHGSDIKTRW